MVVWLITLVDQDLGYGCITDFAESYGYITNIKIELCVISYGMQITWDHDFRDIICELDSQTTLTFIKDGVLPTHPYAINLIDNIRSFALTDWNLVFAHALLEGNSYADWLTKFDASLSHELNIIPTCGSSSCFFCLDDSIYAN